MGKLLPKIRVLLLTNRDSDNVGDQIIEATVISLLRGIMKNLDIRSDEYRIDSRAASIISRAYLKTGDPQFLDNAGRIIEASDVIVFGGAPLFNYTYQQFYLRTIRTLEIAQKYGVPVLFSSIGVEPFDPENPKCLALKEALNLSCVKQITTRDDLESVQKYVEGTNVPVAHVSDPAVFADIVFRKGPPAALRPATTGAGTRTPTRSTPRTARLRRLARRLLRRARQNLPVTQSINSSTRTPVKTPAEVHPKRKQIGLVVTRASIFKDNGIEFSEQDQRDFWLQVMELLAARGYTVKLFTTGHFSDEVFLDAFVRAAGTPMNMVATAVNSPEELIGELEACTGVIAYRLHASITAFAYGIPTIGLSWNFKVPYFYESVGLKDRALSHEHWVATEVVDALETAMKEGVNKDEAFMMTVYETLFSGIKNIFAADSERKSYSHAELRTELPRYPGTSVKTYQEKLDRKFRRMYRSHQALRELRALHLSATNGGLSAE